jgi:hypothetical protein
MMTDLRGPKRASLRMTPFSSSTNFRLGRLVWCPRYPYQNEESEANADSSLTTPLPQWDVWGACAPLKTVTGFRRPYGACPIFIAGFPGFRFAAPWAILGTPSGSVSARRVSAIFDGDRPPALQLPLQRIIE